MNALLRIRPWAVALCAAAFALASATSRATIPNVPLYVGAQVNPNIIFTLDDSGSMSWGFMPDGVGNHGFGLNTMWQWTGEGSVGQQSSARYYFASNVNLMYYNPNILYTPPPDIDGNPMTTSFTAAWINPFAGNSVSYGNASTPTMNLATAYQATIEYIPQPQSNGNGTYWNGSLVDEGFGVGHRVARHPHIDFPIANPQVGVPAYYYRFDPTGTGCVADLNINLSPRPLSLSQGCYVRVNVSATSGTTTLIGADERQNFANWYSFYRTRNLATVSSMLRAQTSIPLKSRVAWQALNTCDNNFTNNCQGWDGVNHDPRIRVFQDNRADFRNWLTRLPAWNGTPLQSAVVRAGEYFKTTGKRSPRAFNPQVVETPLDEAACRRNFHVVMTDGYWNGGYAPPPNFIQDNAVNGLLPSPTDTTLLRPYLDAVGSDTLADLAWHYYMHDIQPTLPDKLDPYLAQRDPNRPSGQSTWTDVEKWNPRNDPATWQHVVHFTVGLGLGGALVNPAWAGSTFAGGYANIANGTTTWPQAGSGSPNNVYDLWHAAINSRGEFFSADTPDSLAIAFKTIVERINETTGAPAGAATSSFRTRSSTANFVGEFDSADWSGTLRAERTDTATPQTRWSTSLWRDGTSNAVPGTMAVSAVNTDGNARNIISHNGSNPVRLLGNGSVDFPTAWSQLSSAQKDALDPNKSKVASDLGLTAGMVSSLGQRGIFEYLLGSRQHELLVPTTHIPSANPTNTAGTNILRARKSLLGDILGSTPTFSWQEDAGYSGLNWGVGTGSGDTYTQFLKTKANRTPVVVAGANDGMLHGFDAKTGKELFAYVPRGVYQNWAVLAAKGYTHKYYVDGQITITDAFLGGSWKTVVVGTLGAGGKNIFALDITHPGAVTENSVLFDLDLSNDDDMGKFLGRPVVSRMQDGQFWAFLGNGYESQNKKSALFAVRLSDGTVRKIVTNDGGTGNPNGMSTITVLRDGKGGYVGYSGDRRGNLWKFDLSSSSNGSWNIAYSGQPLYTAQAPAGSTRQPISAAPLTLAHPLGGEMILFGTGAFYDELDRDYDSGGNTPVQSFYGVWDNLNSDIGSGRNKLVQQTITTVANAADGDRRTQSANAVDWATKRGWYVDLTNNGAKEGERVLARALRIEDRVIFSTFTPTNDVCLPGGTSWIMSMDAYDGSAKSNRFFLDGTNDGAINNSDKGFTGMRVAGGTGELLINLSKDFASDGRSLANVTLKASYNQGLRQSNTRGECVGDKTCRVLGVNPAEFSAWRQVK